MAFNYAKKRSTNIINSLTLAVYLRAQSNSELDQEMHFVTHWKIKTNAMAVTDYISNIPMYFSKTEFTRKS